MTKGERIKELRERCGLTQEELAIKLHTTKQTISKYEKNIVTNIPSDRIESIAKVLNSTPEYILGWEDDPLFEAAKEAAQIFVAQNQMDDRVRELVRKYNSLTDAQKDIIDNTINAFLGV